MNGLIYLFIPCLAYAGYGPVCSIRLLTCNIDISTELGTRCREEDPVIKSYDVYHMSTNNSSMNRMVGNKPFDVTDIQGGGMTDKNLY